MHQDHVKDRPPNFHSLATTAPHTPVHGLLSDDYQCITVQGHPEYKRDAVRILLKLRRDAGIVPREYADQQLARLDKEDESDSDDVWLVERFIDFLLGRVPKLPSEDTVHPDTGIPEGPNVRIGND